MDTTMDRDTLGAKLLPELQQIEKDYYDSNDYLREDLLMRHQEQGVIAERMMAIAN